jgi:hypothetical protein
MWIRTQSTTFAANYIKYKIPNLQNTAAQNKSGVIRTRIYELFNSLLNFVLTYLMARAKQYYSPYNKQNM